MEGVRLGMPLSFAEIEFIDHTDDVTCRDGVVVMDEEP